jgi:cell division control protein 6
VVKVAETAKSVPPLRTFIELEHRIIFKDLSVFDTDYVPEQILIRQEFDPIIRFYFDCLKFRLQQSLVLIGPTGAGKTLASRYYGKQALDFAREQGTDISFVYLNCREIGSAYTFWEMLLNGFGAPPGKGLAVSDLITLFAKAVNGKHHVVIILDELEKLFNNLTQAKANDILYVLTRLRGSRNLDTAISTILISNNAHLLDFFEAPVKSSLNAKNIVIGQYNALDIARILQNRVDAGLKQGVCGASMVSYIAAKAAQFNSDARFAILLLKNSAQLAESEQPASIEEHHVDRAFAVTKKEIELDVINRLSTNQLLVLYAVARMAKQTKERFLPLNPIHKGLYRALCEEHGRKPLVYSQFLSIVSSLQNYDLLSNILQRKGSGGFVRLVEVNFRLEDIEGIYQERMEGLQ